MRDSTLTKVPSTSDLSEKTRIDYDDDLTLGKMETKFHGDKGIEFDSNCTVISTVDVKITHVESIIDPLQEKKLLKKLDLHILPLFCLFYFADFLDRANIGNAT